MAEQKTLIQIIKFAVVGAINTAVDLSVLNMLMFITGIASGFYFSAFKALSFAVAVLNSYFMNKYWTFAVKGKKKEREFSQFFIISVGGIILNVGAASIIVNAVPNILSTSPQTWANVGALSGTFFGLTWNFFGYKYFVFKKIAK